MAARISAIGIANHDTRCAEVLVKYFGAQTKGVKRSLRTLEAFKIFEKDFFQLKAGYPGIGEQTYLVVLSQFSRAGNIWLFERLWEDMKAQGVSPALSHFNQYLVCAAMAADAKAAFRIVNMIKSAGMQPNYRTYSTLMRLFCKRGDLVNGYKVFICAERDGYKSDTRTLSILLTGSRSVAQTKGILKLFRSRKIYPNLQSYTAMLTSCTHLGEWDDAQRFFKQALSNGKIDADHELWVAYICAAFGTRCYDKLCDAIHAMQEAGFTPDIRVHSYTIRLCSFLVEEKGDKYYTVARNSYEMCVNTGIIEIPVATNMVTVLGKLGLVDEIEDVRAYLRSIMKRGETHNFFRAVQEGYRNAGRYTEEQLAQLQPYVRTPRPNGMFYAHGGVPFHHKAQHTTASDVDNMTFMKKPVWETPPRRVV